MLRMHINLPCLAYGALIKRLNVGWSMNRMQKKLEELVGEDKERLKILLQAQCTWFVENYKHGTTGFIMSEVKGLFKDKLISVLIALQTRFESGLPILKSWCFDIVDSGYHKLDLEIQINDSLERLIKKYINIRVCRNVVNKMMDENPDKFRNLESLRN